ncbi:hypothetical protein WMF31_27170 [Sorangium sp. So ce1036]|uniref:hypothetical protein n=1 Tax=Sorangium sp. So ce1036 TaxID=3133328 RepID=UPI003F036249
MSWNQSSAGAPGAAEPRTGGAPLERKGEAPVPDEAAPLPQAPGPGVPIEPEPLRSSQLEPPSLAPTKPASRKRPLAEAQFRPEAGAGLAAEQEGDRRDNAPEMPSDEDLERARQRAASTPK